MNETATDARTEAKAKTTLGDGKRRPGRAPGLPKVPGSGRKKGSGNHVTKDAKEDVAAVLEKNGGAVFTRLCQIALGRKIRMGAGPNVTTVYPSETSQMKAIEILARKLRPDLTAQAIDQTIDDRRENQPVDSRNLARAVLDIFRGAELEDTPKPASLPHPPAQQTAASDSLCESERPSVLPDGVYSETEDETELNNGARVERSATESGEVWFRVLDHADMFHRKLRDHGEAVAFAKTLPGPSTDLPPLRPHYTLNGVEVDEAPREARLPIKGDSHRIVRRRA